MRVHREMSRRVALGLALGLLAAARTGVLCAEEFDLGPLDTGMRLLKLSTRDLRVKSEYVEDRVGGGELRLRLVTDGLRGVVSSAANARDLGYRLTDEADLARSYEMLSALLDEGHVPAQAPPGPLHSRSPLAVALEKPNKRETVQSDGPAPDPIPWLPLELRRALAELVYGVARANTLLDRTLRDLSPEDEALVRATLPAVLMQERTTTLAATLRSLRVCAGLDLRAVVSGTAVLVGTIEKAREALADLRLEGGYLATPTAAEPLVFTQPSEFGVIVVAGTGDDEHTTPAAILVDLGGNDRYAAAPSEEGSVPAVQVVIDLSGDDSYTPSGSFGPSAALLGISVLIDEAGDDQYTAKKPYSFGAAIYGAGILVDAAGDDRYLRTVFGQGAAMFGLGMLIDAAGNDVYEGGPYAQGFGSVKGVGALIDLSGTDHYQAGGTYSVSRQGQDRVLACSQGFGLGLRGVGAPGGVGILADADGGDTYSADTYSQGSAWWYGAGLLFDRAGDDQYQSAQSTQYTQGSAGFLSVGHLLDEAGNDRYGAGERAQGFGLDRAIGLLRDAAGNDSYTAERLAQGAAMGDGMGLAIDLSGSDAYLVREGGQGFVPRGEGRATVALFGDGGGDDSYVGQGDNDLCWSEGRLGLGIDRDGDDLAKMNADMPATSGRIPLPFRQPTGSGALVHVPGGPLVDVVDLDTLWRRATQVEDARIRRAARYDFARLGEQAAPFLAEKLREPSENAIKDAQAILAQMGAPAVPELIKLMDEGGDREARAAMVALSKIGDPRAAGYLVRQAKSAQWRTRAAAAGGMGAQFGEDTRFALQRLLRDQDEDVRRSAVIALRRRGELQSAEAISGLLGDPVFSVRFAAAHALVTLVSLGVACPPHVFSLVASDRLNVRYLSIDTCGLLGSKKSLRMLIRLLDSDDWADRIFAAQAICRIGDPDACDDLREALAKEKNGLVRARARDAVRASKLCAPLDDL